MLNLSLDPVNPDFTGQHENELYELLKSAGGDAPKNNEDDSTVGTTHVYDEPDDRGEAGTIDAPWGEAGPTKGGDPEADMYSNGVWAENKEVRPGVLKNVLDSKVTSDQVEQRLMSQNFKHVADGDFSTHSTHLQPKSVEKISHPRSVSLMSQLRKVTGHI